MVSYFTMVFDVENPVFFFPLTKCYKNNFFVVVVVLGFPISLLKD